jgi:hypothetical protein
MTRYRFKLHHCKNCVTAPGVNDHFHLILGTMAGGVSWPLWSVEAVEKAFQMLVGDYPDSFTISEVARLHVEFESFACLRARDSRGRFGSWRIPRRMGQGVAEIAFQWNTFLREQKGSIGYPLHIGSDREWFPVECDFAERESKNSPTADPHDIDLMIDQTVSRPKDPLELGIVMEEV